MSDKNNSDIRILVADSDRYQGEMITEFLRLSGFSTIDFISDEQGLWEGLRSASYDILLINYELQGGKALDILEQLPGRGHYIPVIMFLAPGEERLAVAALQKGAMDYLITNGDYLITLPSLINRAVYAYHLRQSVHRSIEQAGYQALLLSNVRDAIVVWDMDGRITYWNLAAEVLFGYGAHDRLGELAKEVYFNAFNPPILPPGPEQTTGNYMEYRYQTPTGKAIWISSRLAVLRDTRAVQTTAAVQTPAARRQLIGYMHVSHDITRNKQAERALKESEARYRAIVEDYQTELICRFQPDGKFTFVNEVYCQYFGQTRQQLLDANLFDYLPPADRPAMIEHLDALGPRRPSSTLEHRMLLPNENIRWFQRTDRAIFDPRGQLIEIQSMGRDISDRKKMEALIQAAQAHLVEAARLATLGELSSGVAHQINNPLTTIIADAQILLSNLPPDSIAAESARAIEQAGWRLLEVVKQLLEFSRPSGDAVDVISVNETIKNSLSLVGAQIISLGIELKIDLSDALPPVKGNPQQLQNLWVNLLLFARNACMGEGGRVIRILSTTEAGSNVQVDVKHNGQSIPATQLATIFEPNLLDATPGHGTGLELSICREIVRQYGGQITAQSATDGQVAIIVWLPALVQNSDETLHHSGV